MPSAKGRVILKLDEPLYREFFASDTWANDSRNEGGADGVGIEMYGRVPLVDSLTMKTLLAEAFVEVVEGADSQTTVFPTWSLSDEELELLGRKWFSSASKPNHFLVIAGGNTAERERLGVVVPRFRKAIWVFSGHVESTYSLLPYVARFTLVSEIAAP